MAPVFPSRTAVRLATVAVAVSILASTAVAWSPPLGAPEGVPPVVTFWRQYTSGTCKTEWSDALADDCVMGAPSATPTGLPIVNNNKTDLMDNCAFYNPKAGPSMLPSPESTWDVHEYGTFSQARVRLALVAGPPIVGQTARAAPTANCTVLADADETIVVDAATGKYTGGTDLITTKGFARFIRWWDFCSTKKPFPTPDNSKGADIVTFVQDWADLYLSGSCDAAGAFMAKNYTEFDAGLLTAPMDRDATIQACKDATGQSLLAAHALAAYATGNGDTVQLDMAVALVVKDPTTDRQCTAFGHQSATTHTYMDPGTGTRVIDSYTSFSESDLLTRLAAQCHLKARASGLPRSLQFE